MSTTPTPAITAAAAEPNDLPVGQILVGDAAERLRRLPTASVDTIVTSPPYFRLRDYQTDGQIGLESTVDDWVQSLRAVMAEAVAQQPAVGFQGQQQLLRGQVQALRRSPGLHRAGVAVTEVEPDAARRASGLGWSER